jgi:ribosomal protein L18
MILVAHLATAGGVRTPLARVANQVFADLTDELSAQGVTKSVIADMFGMALSTYHRRARAAAESKTDAGRSVWEAVLGFVREKEPVAGAVVLGRFARDDSGVVASVLKDLTDSGLVYRTGRGKQAMYRVASPSDFASVDGGSRSTAIRHILWLTIVRRGRHRGNLRPDVRERPLPACGLFWRQVGVHDLRPSVRLHVRCAVRLWWPLLGRILRPVLLRSRRHEVRQWRERHPRSVQLQRGKVRGRQRRPDHRRELPRAMPRRNQGRHGVRGVRPGGRLPDYTDGVSARMRRLERMPFPHAV